MNNLNLRFKILGGFTFIFWMTTTLVFLGMWSLTRIGEKATTVASSSLPSVYIMGEIRALNAGNYINLAQLIVADKKDQPGYLEELQRTSKSIGTLYKNYEKLMNSDEVRALYTNTSEHRKNWLQARVEIVDLVTSGKNAEARDVFLNKSYRVFNDYRQSIGELCDLNKREGEAIAKQTHQDIAGAIGLFWGGIAVTLVLALALSLIICRTITQPIQQLLVHVAAIAKGDLNSKCDYVSTDEIGVLATNMNGMAQELKSAQTRERATVEKDAQDQRVLQQKVDAILEVVRAVGTGDLTQSVPVSGADSIGQLGEGIDSLISDLNSNMLHISENANALAAAAEELSATAREMSLHSEETTSQATSVSAASEQVSRNVQTVATGTEEMSASIKEIAKNANDAAQVATSAVKSAEGTNQAIARLGESSTEIGKAIKVITSIAQQTNLLALNATIEAARAGTAGKGFAVVANEVKELAKETAKATGEISRMIQAIQDDTAHAVGAIHEIGDVIGQINEISNSIASAVEEQSATTNEIGQNVAEAARGVADITHNITNVANAAQNTNTGAGDSQRASAALSEMAANLQNLVSRFTLNSERATSMESVAHSVKPLAQPKGSRTTRAGRSPSILSGSMFGPAASMAPRETNGSGNRLIRKSSNAV